MARYLIELTGSDGNIYGFDTGRGFSPTDPDASLYRSHYAGEVAKGGAPVITRGSEGAGTNAAPVGASFGTIRLNNADRDLDVMDDLGFDGRALTIRYLPDGAKTVAAATVVYRGTVTRLQADRYQVTVDARDRLEELRVPVGRLVDADEWPDAEGVRKPVVSGKALECPILWVDRVKNIGIIHDGVADVDSSGSPLTGGVYDLGVALEREGDYADLATLKITAPTAGKYRVYPSSEATYIRLGSRPADHDKVAADVLVTDYDGPAQLQSLVARAGTISDGSPSDIDAASFTALSRSWTVGGRWDGETPVIEAVADLSRSLGCVVFFGRTGLFKAARLSPATGSEVAAFFGPQSKSQGGGASQLLTINRRRISEPVKEVSVGYDKVFAVKSDLDALWSTDATRAELISREYRRSVITDAATETKHLLAREEAFDTILRDQTNAETMAEEWRSAQGAWFYTMTVKATQALLAALEIGARVNVYDAELLPTETSLVIRTIRHNLNTGEIEIGARE
jgi:hypothetical protein